MKRTIGLVLVALTACADGSTTPDTGLSDDDVRTIAPAFDALSADVFDELSFASGPSYSLEPSRELRESTTTFVRTRSCPAGGEVRVEGTLQRTADLEAGVRTASFDATKTHLDCTFTRGDVEIVLNGDPNVQTEAFRRFQDGVLVEATASHQGAFRWEKGESSGQCVVDLVSTFDPDTRTITVTGTFCGRSVHRTRVWTPRPQG